MFMGFSPFILASPSDLGVAERTFATVATLDAFEVISTTRRRADGSKEVGDHRLKI